MVLFECLVTCLGEGTCVRDELGQSSDPLLGGKDDTQVESGRHFAKEVTMLVIEGALLKNVGPGLVVMTTRTLHILRRHVVVIVLAYECMSCAALGKECIEAARKSGEVRRWFG